MKRYNLSSIMKDAWSLYRTAQKWVDKLSFGECLKRAWSKAKLAARVFTGMVRDVQVAGTLMHPVLVNVDMDDLQVTGNTYAARKELKAAGLTWDAEARAWTGSRATLNALCVKYA